MDETPDPCPPLHPNCRCRIEPMQAIYAGEATKDGQNGADYWIKHHGTLPPNYISKEDLEKLGWRRGKRPAKYIRGKMVTLGEYADLNEHLPQAPGRIWYEADINYYEGWRNRHRIVWSNDGLIFVTYNHYESFYQII